ncbi:DNA repair protein RadA [Parascardovia denticolens DSM 10105 = JCM 12538]|uniref:DNA repair protein RadA n=1 Tax=Parascardovia denticolens DSM 10105 = JCM 12538 TaxID=864564 RepID=E6K0T4_PARDN|nr:DNA repair protein RadA [Parascardovia denticolens]EFG33035.2 DNA repair protein RadA [Parascardovia denticolens F0305]EFT83415.1 DNA repair protein RadA [Parascardovia denticolens DSM 10105 = JCM 12538]BAR05695.1 DNA repair protein [Parascardovia denticolens DSM 10105 = JCM 12538]
MAKSNVQYVCSDCGWNGAKWYGRCPNCGQWGTIEEFHEAKISPASSRASSAKPLSKKEKDRILRPVTDEGLEDVVRIPTGFGEFDRVLGGGIVPGAVILMAGEPGIGKSTLLLETAGNIARSLVSTGKRVLYISGEESLSQIRMRARRIGAVVDNLLLASTMDLGTVVSLIQEEKPALAIVDSVQTISSPDVDGIQGGNAQIRQVAAEVIDCAKSLDIPVILVGHVTKDGSIAGPRTLEHLVDVVCQFEGDSQTALRLLRSLKNRFGPTDEVGCFDMSGEGIEEITDPSGLFVSAADQAAEGTCITFIVDGHRSLPMEIQALTTSSALPAPRRTTNGVDYNRLAMIIAVLYRHGRINLLSSDVYVSTVAGGSAREPGCDLAIAAALASASKGKAIARTTIAIGEISLTGQIRPVPRMANRLREAARLGFTTALVPVHRKGSSWQQVEGMKLVEVATVKEALAALGI